ncbi:MAG: phosphatase PAP2 family protein [Candidatus Aenigmarchaeota archaeon]|nr:phosphatase PAP2 family protein [Candidatus Aenigmarchaeota archaeon]
MVKISGISKLIERKPFHLLLLILVGLNLSGIATSSNQASLTALIAIFISASSSVVIKMLLKTNRPRLNKYRIIRYGFPSSHTQIAFSIVTVYAKYAPQFSILFFALAIFVACTRVFLKAHKKIDVIGGAVLGIITGLISLSLFS